MLRAAIESQLITQEGARGTAGPVSADLSARAGPPTMTPAAVPAEASAGTAVQPPEKAVEEEKLASANARADAILEEYAATDRLDPDAARRSCLLLAVALFLFGVAGLLAVYFFRYR